jgi:glycosyltransferase involved in cell wall biosynthesis
MRLLLLTPAELTRDVRARRCAVAARERGWDVDGVCGQISGLSPAALEGVHVVRTGRRGRAHALWSAGSGAARGAAASELRALARLARLVPRTARLVAAARGLPRPDVVHAHDLDTLPAAWLVARRGRSRLVYDAHELYSEFEHPVPRLARRLTLALEGALARRADAVVTVSEGIAAELAARLRLRERPLVVLNAPARAEAPGPGANGGPLRAVYQGGLGPGRELDDLLAAAGAEGVELTLRISLADPDVLRRTVAARGLAERVRVLDPVPPEDAVGALAGFDAGIIFDRPRTRNGELSFPNKLFEYLMAGLAVVAPRLEEIGPLLDGERVGVTYEPDRPEALAGALERLAADPALLAELRGRARALAVERLNAEAEAATLARAWGA